LTKINKFDEHVNTNSFYVKTFLTKVFLRNLFFFLRNDIFLATRSSEHIRDSSNKVDAELLNDFRDPLQYKEYLIINSISLHEKVINTRRNFVKIHK